MLRAANRNRTASDTKTMITISSVSPSQWALKRLVKKSSLIFGPGTSGWTSLEHLSLERRSALTSSQAFSDLRKHCSVTAGTVKAG